MDPNDGLSEANPQEHAVANMIAEDPTSWMRQNSNDIASANNPTQPGDPPPNLETTAQQQFTENVSQESVEQPQFSSNAAPMLEHHESHPGILAQEPSHINPSQNHFGEPAPQLCEDVLPAELSVNAAHHISSLHTNNEDETNESSPPGLELHNVQHVATAAAPISATPSESAPPTATPESLRGDPYRLSDSLTVANYKSMEVRSEARKSRALEGQHEENSAVACKLLEGVETDQLAHSHNDPADLERSDQYSYPNERERRISENDSSLDEHDCGDDEDDQEFRQHMQSQMDPPVQGEQDFQMSLRDPCTGQSQQQPHSRGSGIRGYGQQQRPQAIHPRGFHEQDIGGFPDAPLNMQHSTGFQPFGQQDSMMDDDFMRGRLHMPLASPMMPNFYQSVTQSHQQHVSRGQSTMDYQDPHYAMQSYSQYLSAPGSNYLPGPPQSMQAHVSESHAANHRPQKHVAMPDLPKTIQRGGRKLRVVKDSDSTDDDKPLRTQAARHPSVTSDSATGSSPPAQKSLVHSEQQDDDEEPQVQFMSSGPKLGFKAAKGKKMAPRQPPPPPKPVQTQNTTRKDSSSSAGSIDWKLPEYEAQFEPGATKHDPTLAKVSIPGIVREKLLLSPDHADQETHLLLNLFLPTQQALAVPEEKPAVAILNFHTVAVMVIEAFVQFEIGDEYGMGRGHWHNDHDEGDADYERQRDAKDADQDEIFFAVIDRWRAGIESNKAPLKLIRGVQEFCEIALDIIHYIKEHGLLKGRQRAIRSDKGVKRGAKKVGEDEEQEKEANKSVKRGAGKINEPAVRKKAKVEVKAKPKGKVPTKKKKTSTVGVTVIRKR